MKFLARMMMVVGLLGVLAYGSFAFGKYVLSAKLFGDDGKSGGPRTVSRSTTEASAVTRQTGWKGSKPRVEVKVLPADQTGPGPDLPQFSDEDGFDSKPKSKASSKTDDDQPSRVTTSSSEDDSSKSSTPKSGAAKRNVDDAPVEYSLGSEKATRNGRTERSDEGEARPRRRRRRKRSSAENNSNRVRRSRDQVEPAPAREDVAPVGDGREDNNSGGDDSAISVTTDRSPSRERSTPRRRRERVRERPRSSSPVPRPESSSGSDSGSISPVPQPE